MATADAPAKRMPAARCYVYRHTDFEFWPPSNQLSSDCIIFRRRNLAGFHPVANSIPVFYFERKYRKEGRPIHRAVYRRIPERVVG